jgi:hypothetical protein
MRETILVYGNESLSVMTPGLILERAGYKVFTATKFALALLALVDEQIDVLLLCQSLSDEERRGIVETACAVKPEIKCVTIGYDGREIEPTGGVALAGLA